MDGLRAWATTHANYSKRTLERMFRVQRECMYPKLVKDVGQVRLAVMQWEEKWTVMMSELGEGAKIPDLWRMSALLEICPKGCEGTDVVEVGRSRRELREPQGEGDIVHVESRPNSREVRRKQQCRWSSTKSVEVRCTKKKWDDVDEGQERSKMPQLTRRAGLQDERKGQRERKGRRQGIWQNGRARR